MLNISKIITIEEQPEGRCEIKMTDRQERPIRPDETYKEVVSAIVSINRAGPYEQAFLNGYRG